MSEALTPCPNNVMVKIVMTKKKTEQSKHVRNLVFFSLTNELSYFFFCLNNLLLFYCKVSLNILHFKLKMSKTQLLQTSYKIKKIIVG